MRLLYAALEFYEKHQCSEKVDDRRVRPAKECAGTIAVFSGGNTFPVFLYMRIKDGYATIPPRPKTCVEKRGILAGPPNPASCTASSPAARPDVRKIRVDRPIAAEKWSESDQRNSHAAAPSRLRDRKSYVRRRTHREKRGAKKRTTVQLCECLCSESHQNPLERRFKPRKLEWCLGSLR